MAANPYITIPAGNINQQNMLIQAYYRNLALQNQYAQQQYQYDQQGHQWENALALGVGKGIGSGFDQYLGAVDQTAKFNQQNQLQMFSDVNQAQRQHDLFAQQDAAQTEREQAAAQAEQRRALLAEYTKQREQRQRGEAFQSVFGAMEPQSVTAPPVDYNDVSQTTVTPGQSVQQAIMGLSPSQAGLMPNEFYQKAMETPKAGGLTESEALARYKEVQALVDSGNPEAAQRLQASLTGSAYAGALPTAKPPTPTRFPVSAEFGSFLRGHGIDTLEQFDAYPLPAREAMYKQWKAEVLRQQVEVQTSSDVLKDRQQRAQKADEALGQLNVIGTSLDKVEPLIPQLLQPGIQGRITGGAKAALNEWIQAYPELKQLTSYSEGIMSQVARYIQRETGNLSTGDVERASRAFVVQQSDSLEFALIKARALRMFLTAAEESWNIYRQTSFTTPPEEIKRLMADAKQRMSDAMTVAEHAPAGAKAEVGANVTLEGETIRVDKINPDGSIEGVNAQGRRRRWTPGPGG